MANVSIKGMKFDPPSLTVASGDTVTWTNQDPMAHTVVGDNGEFSSNGTIAKNGGTFSYKFTNPATINYHCSIHPGMKGQIVVT